MTTWHDPRIGVLPQLFNHLALGNTNQTILKSRFFQMLAQNQIFWYFENASSECHTWTMTVPLPSPVVAWLILQPDRLACSRYTLLQVLTGLTFYFPLPRRRTCYGGMSLWTLYRHTGHNRCHKNESKLWFSPPSFRMSYHSLWYPAIVTQM